MLHITNDKSLRELTLQTASIIFNDCLNQGRFPSEWKKG